MLPITGAGSPADAGSQPGPLPEADRAAAAVVARALARLDELPGAPAGAHVAVFDTVHRLLQDALATLDEA
ncbi:MAG: hypothetical protein ACR2K2_16940 [Mycobacteriales bacterium]